VSSSEREEGHAVAPTVNDASRKRAAIETYSRHEKALRRTARRYSICADDADDALQRALEILLVKAPTVDPRELIRWSQTVVKHEALGLRRERERILSGPAAATPEPGREDWVALLPSKADGPPERAERQEAIARSREALRTLKPQELRALTLLAEGYSYKEIAAITGYSQTKINRCLAEGREKFRGVFARSRDGSRCEELRPLLSAFCDGEAGSEEAATLREHLRACAGCRATLRAYRAAPRAATALLPALPAGRSLLERAHDALGGLGARFGGGSDSALSQVAASGGTRGAGLAGLAKLAAICVGTAGGAAACVATGVVPAPLVLDQEHRKAPVLERKIDPTLAAEWEAGTDTEPESAVATEPAPEAEPVAAEHTAAPEPKIEPATTPVPEPAAATEYAPPPEPAPVAAPPVESAPASTGGGSPAGEFGP
jgi:RNA polymerase sigma factor (sigma-70 family)